MVLLLSAPWLARAQEQQASDKPQAAKTAQWTGSFDFKSGSNYQKGESINYRYSNAGGEFSGMEGLVHQFSYIRNTTLPSQIR